MTDEKGAAPSRWLCGALGLKGEDTPFPWQTALLEDLQNGRLPPAIDIPTGLGKTSVMAIWLVARALGAALPRRLVYVVDRRAVVDQATEVALRLRDFVEEAQEIRELLGLSGRALPVSTLRGQYVDNREWLDDPTGTAIIVGTVDMIGSRLLFQGYGVSRKMRPYHAGLLGADTLVTLDEAHLVPAFDGLLREIADGIDLFGPRDEERRALVPRFRLMSLSATGRNGAATTTFRLTKKDLEHPKVARRLNAPKRLFVRHLKKDDKLAEALTDEAWKLSGNGRRPIRCIVFCDKREDAEKVKEAVERSPRGDKKTGTEAVKIEPELFVGGRRIFERQNAAKHLENLGFIAGNSIQPTRPTFLFATSAAEVGVDLDADCMVCDLVAWERMVQRLGRVNRRGDVAGGADVMVVIEPEPEPDKRTQEALSKKPEGRDDKERAAVDKYEKAIARQRALRKPLDLLCWTDGTADASSGAIRDLNESAGRTPGLLGVLDRATTIPPLRPALTRPVVDAWSMTSLEFHPGRPEVEPWLRGWIEDDPPQTEVIWRTYLPARVRGQASVPAGKQDIEAFFETAPPQTSEVLETETFRVLKWLAARAKALLGGSTSAETANTNLHGRDIAAIVLTKGGRFKRSLRVEEIQAEKNEREELHQLLANAVLIVDARVAGLNAGLLHDKEADPPLTLDGSQPWVPAAGFRVRSVDARQSGPRDSHWRERFRFAQEVSEEGEALRWLIVEKERGASANEEDRSAANPQLLDEHQEWTEDCARALAKGLGLPQEYREMLCTAAFLHDEGKRAHHWQRAFNAPAGKDVWAKTEGPINYALLDGYRHELGSLISVQQQERLQRLPPELRELVLHLIAAHHGFGRPAIGTHACAAAPPSALEAYAKSVALRFAELQYRWGPWGLAWWESLLRAADQQSSRVNDAGGTTHAVAVTPGGK
jgi:CRISPR-associated endonuclease/helicase Cas3